MIFKKTVLNFFATSILSLMVFGCFDGLAQHTPSNLFYLTHDNDFLNPLNSTDQYYSFGIISGYQALVGNKGRFLQSDNQMSDSTNKIIVGLQLALRGYTPSASVQHDIDAYERPFAGTLTVKPYLISTNVRRLFRVELETGVRGPSSQAGDFQNWLHNKMDDYRVEGWENQLDHKVLFNLYGSFARSVPLTQYLEMVPESSMALGNLQTYIQQSFKLRIGRFNEINNTSSYGTSLGTGKTKYNTEIFTSLSVFGRISLVDATLGDDLLIEEFPGLSHENLRGGYQVKFNVLFRGVGLFLAYNHLSPGTILSDSHGYGTISFSYSW